MIQLAGSELQYFFGSGKKSTILRIGAELAEEADRGCLQRAAMRSIRFFPKIKTRPVLTPDGKVLLEENREEIPVFSEDEGIKKLGTDETAGYLFRLSCIGRKIFFSYSHVLTDARGGFSFLTCVLVEYYREKGIVPEEMKPAVSEEDCSSPDLMSVPSDFAVAHEALAAGTEVENVFHIPETMTLEGTAFSKLYAVCIEKESLLRRTKETGTTPLTFLLAAMGRSINRLYSLEGNIVAGVPVDLHALYSVASQSNFTESVDLIYDETMKNLSFEESAGLLRRQLNEKKQRDVLLAKVAAMREGYEMIRQIPFNNGKLLEAFSERIRYGNSKMTFLLSNPGNVTLPEEISSQVKDLFLDIPSNGLSCMIVGYGDGIRLLLSQEWMGAELAEEISRTLRENGAENIVKDCGVMTFDEISLGSFKSASEN